MGSWFKKHISEPTQNFIHDPIGGLKSIGKDALKYNPYTAIPYFLGETYLNKRASQRAQQNADDLLLLEQTNTLNAEGKKELDNYASGELTQSQKDTIKSQTAIQRAQLLQAMGGAGIADSSMRVTEEGNIGSYAVGMGENYREQHWDAAMKILGLSGKAQDILHQTHVDHMAENIEVYSSMMNTLGSIGGLMAGGGSGSSVADSESKGVITDTGDPTFDEGLANA